MNQIFDDDSALEQRKQNEFFFSSDKATQAKTIKVFGTTSIEPQSASVVLSQKYLLSSRLSLPWQ